MEDISDIFKEDIEKEIARFRNKKILTVDKIFPGFYINILKKLRYYEVDSIEDLKRNYEKLSKVLCIELSYEQRKIKNKIFSEMMEYYGNEMEEYFNLTGGRFHKFSVLGIEFNLNPTFIQNVYLDNFDFIKRKSFEAFEFDIKDIYNEKIKGVFVYFDNGFRPEENNIAKKQMVKVISSLPSVSFDLDFIVLPENDKIKTNGSYVVRGKKLSVKGIYRIEERNKEEDHTPTGSNVSSLVSVH